MSLLTKIASTALGTKITADTSRAGLPGIALGVIATRLMTRSPIGTLLVGGAWLGHKLWQKKREIDAAGSRTAPKKVRPKQKPKALPRARHAAHARANGSARSVAAGI